MADFPNIEPDLEEIALIANNQVYNSPLTGQAQTASLTGAKWQCTPTFSNRNGKEARDLRAFLFDQEGVSGRFNYYPASIDNIGTHAGGGVVDGAGQTGKELVTKGWDADQPLLFSAGDYLTVNGEMKMVTADVAVDQDYIEYDETNYMPSPFDPEGWYGETVDPDGSITNTTLPNASGQSFMGLAERTGAGGFNLTGFPTVEVSIGESLYGSMLIKKANALGAAFRFRIADSSGFLADIAVTSDTGEYVAGGLDYSIDLLGDNVLIQFKYTVIRDAGAGVYCQSFIWTDDNTGEPPIGSQLYVQAAFFGKANDWPATVSTQGVVPDQTVTINTGGQQVDYIGIAKHNLNQIGLTVAIKYNGITVVPAQPVSEKQALLFLNNIASPDTVELIISGATIPPRIAVLYVGKALRLQRNIYVGHTPISYGRNRTAINGVSENGQYLGEIVVREVNNTSVNLQNLTPDWYRQNLDPFFALSPRPPCFWAWRPSKYEDEVGYCWIEGDPQMSNQRSNGMVQCSWNFKGIV